ncbi:PEP-CTERM sorting domain-containing protein [Sulfuriroseicoccus oceanibius]|uniref:PEP-CTERM sorting domain-containing protein n=1 Tax=Sulfuriroseicoccus oceanibius TaxID=2707525 RepID=A0A6B3LBM5_9BACT|nr:PEP-CTERM sorting domain-containing protein [Sulfuriroseicoccus oceanibius]QQL46056.1 PEP-CTERM sorting domain-containing protein [Sulfuriroseicoccus oceanibius]
MKKHLTTGAAMLLLTAAANAAVINFSDDFAGSTRTDPGDDSAATATKHHLNYSETANTTTEIRTQEGPFNNGGTLFLAALANEAQSATYLASNTGLGAGVGDQIWVTSSALTLTADFASNWKDVSAAVTSGFMLEGATSDLIVSWNPGGTNYSVGLGALSITAPTDVVGSSLFSGSASAPTGTTFGTVSLSLIENGANYDFTLTMGGSTNSFSVGQASLGSIEGIGFYNAANGGGGNTNIDNVTLTGITGVAAVPEPSSAALLGLGGVAMILRRRK